MHQRLCAILFATALWTLPAFARLGRRPDDATTSILLIGNFPPQRHVLRADSDIKYK